jgi:hypothetical protein
LRSYSTWQGFSAFLAGFSDGDSSLGGYLRYYCFFFASASILAFTFLAGSFLGSASTFAGTLTGDYFLEFSWYC